MISAATELPQNLQIDCSLDLPSFRNAIIIVDVQSHVQENIAKQTERYFVSDQKVSCRILSLAQASSLADLEDYFCLSLIEMEAPLLSNLDDRSLRMVQQVLTKASGILWVTGGGGTVDDEPKFHLIDGLARVSRTELDKHIFVTLALESRAFIREAVNQAQHIRQVLEQTFSQPAEDVEPEFEEKEGRLEIGRVVEASNLNNEVFTKTRAYQHKMQEFGSGPPLMLHIESPGALDSLVFLEAVLAQSLAPGELEIKVECIGANFRDCLTALGQLDDKILGVECAGVVSRVGAEGKYKPGDRVLSLNSNAYQTYARAKTHWVTKIPDGMSFTEASALPTVYCTVWIALQDTARLQRGESVLVHAGAGGTGQATIQIAQYLGAEVFVTVGSDKKKRLLMDLYGIPEDHIFFSRNTSFAHGIMRTTNNRGVDVVLNSLSGEGLRASWECIACVRS